MLNMILQSVWFPLKLLIGTLFFAQYLKKREHFGCNLFLCFLLCCLPGFVFGKNISSYDVIFLINGCTFILYVCLTYFCFRNSFFSTLFCGGIILATQQITFNVITIGYLYARSVFSAYPEVFENVWLNLFLNLFHIAGCCFGYWLVRRCFWKKVEYDEDIVLDNKSVVLIVVGLVELIFFSFWHIIGLGVGGTKLYIGLYFMVAICCFFAIGYMFSIFNLKKMDIEMETMRQILRVKEEQYTTSRDSIEIINRKCHDLKYMIAALEDKKNAEEIRQISDAIDIYGTIPNTGNSALEVILSEYALRCRENDIEFTCIVDGTLFGFMKDTDLYSLFGNALSNAMEGTMKVEEEEKYIHLSIDKSMQGNFIRVQVENNFDGKVEMENGCLQTTKEKNGYHGFGIKSMEYLVEKYDGGFSCKAEGKRFCVNMMFPLENLAG